jgi:TonB family protein
MARSQMERYKQLGLNVADPNMPAEVAAELEKMRATLELVVNQAKELSDGKKRSAEAFGLLEEVTNVRSVMSRDAYDSTRWKNEVADARERLSNSQATVVNVDEPLNDAANVAQNNSTVAANKLPVFNTVGSAQLPPPNTSDNSKPAVATEKEVPAASPTGPASKEVSKEVKPDTTVNQNGGNQNNAAPAASTDKTVQTRTRTSDDKVAGSEKLVSTDNNTTASIGSLVEMATKKVAPVYPVMAKNMRVSGVVRVDVVLDEQGSVMSAQAQGPEVLKRAAMDAVKQWRFKPVVKDGQPTKASGFINFNFSL